VPKNTRSGGSSESATSSSVPARRGRVPDVEPLRNFTKLSRTPS
jgi:hypothetical protein